MTNGHTVTYSILGVCCAGICKPEHQPVVRQNQNVWKRITVILYARWYRLQPMILKLPPAQNPYL